jgi:hypothetical protein
LKQSTLVSIAVAFLVAIGAVIWVCYLSFKGSVMSFETTNAPAPLATPPPTRPPPPVGAPVVAPERAPAQAQDVFPTFIPTLAPTAAPQAPSRQLPNGPPPPDG